MDELVSVIIPVRNCEKYIAEAIVSVLAQDYRCLELLVIDDGSTDSTAKIVHEFQEKTTQINYSYQLPMGLSVARNRGIELAQGNYITFLDADDRWRPHKISKQIAALEMGLGDMIVGQVVHFISPDIPEIVVNNILYPTQVMAAYTAGAILIDKSSLLRVGEFNPSLQVGEFIDWYLRAIDLGLTSFCLPDIVLERRVHQDNMSKKLAHFRQDYVRAIKASLDRRRKRDGKYSHFC